MDSLIAFAAAPLAAAILAFTLAPAVTRLAVVIGAIDVPGHRKVHDKPTPRLGGLAVVASIALVWGAAAVLTDWSLPADLALGVGVGVLPILAISLADDIRSVSPWNKLLLHVAGSSIAVACGVSLSPQVHLFGTPIPLGALAVPLSIVWLVGVTNAFNIIDGLDGLSAGLALISSVSMAAVFVLVHQPAMASASLVMAGALAGFLPYNIHPARLFLGDSGASALGFCLAAFALRGGSTLSTGFAVLVPVLILGLPIADAVIAVARRTISRIETRVGGVLVSDRNHIHHRLLALGVHHSRAVLILYAAGLALAGVAFVSLFLSVRHAALLIVAVLTSAFIGLHRLGYDEFAFIRRGTVLRVYEVPAFNKSMFVVFVDLALVAVAAFVAVGLKLDAWTSPIAARMTMDLVGTFAPLTSLIFWKTGMYRGSWRLASVADLARAVGATALVTASGIAMHTLLWQAPHPPSMSVLLIYGLVSLVLVAASRSLYVLLSHGQRRASNQGRPVLVYGAGRHGVAAVQELFDNADADLRPVGFIDDNPLTRGSLVSGLPVLGALDQMEHLIEQHAIEALLVATATLDPHAFERARAVCARTGIGLLRRQVRLEQLEDRPGRAAEVWESARTGSPIRHAPAISASRHGPTAPERVPWGGECCAGCGSRHVHRSRSRNVFERIRKARSPKRPYRCRDCGWRGWLLPLEVNVPAAAPAWSHSWGPEIDFDEELARLDAEPEHAVALRTKAI